MEEEEKKNREKIIGKEKDETKIVDNQNRVIDIDMLLLEKTNNSAVQGINYLLGLNTKCVDKEFITKRFEEKAGNVLDEYVALEVLKVVLEEAIIEINEKDEYFYINTSTGKVDPEKSQQKIREYGVASNVSGSMQETVDKYFDKQTSEKDNKKENKTYVTKEFIQRKNAEVDSFFFKNKQSAEVIKQVNETKVEREYIGDKLYEEYLKIGKQLKEYQEKYLDDYSSIEEIELLEFDTKLRAVMNTPRFEEILNERNEFLRKHEELQEFINPDTGLIYDEAYDNYIKEREQDNDNLVKAGVIKHITFISMGGLENITEEQRKNAVMDIVAGLKFEETREEVSKFLEKLVPGFKYSEEINNKENRIAVEAAITYDKDKELGKEGFDRLIEASYKTVLSKTDRNEIIKDDVRKVTDAELAEYMAKNSQEINVAETIIEKTGTEEDRYFIGSEIEFTEDDNKAFQYIYKKSTIGTWLDSRDEALIKRFQCLQNSKEELENSNSNSKLVEKRLKEINEEISRFKRKYPSIDYDSMLDENGKLLNNGKKAIQSYTQLRAISKLTKEFIADEEKVNNYNDYNKLSDKDKKAYLLNTIAALNQKDIEHGAISNDKTKDILKKLGNRRLEILNNKKQTFVSIDDGNIKLNTKEILKEYNKLSSHKFKSYEELVEYCELNKLQYVNDKMKLCEELGENGFEKLVRVKITDDEKLKRIEQSKLVNWNKREFYGNMDNMILGNADEKTINELNLSDKLKNNIKILNENIKNEDIVLMEFQRLQAEIDTAHGVKQKQYIKQRDQLIRNNPDRYNDFLDSMNNQADYDSRLYEYNNAIIAKNVLLTVGTINGLSDEDVKTLVENPEERNKVLLTLIASFEGALEDDLEVVLQAIQKICPNMKHLKKREKTDVDLEEMLPLIGEELGIEDCDEIKMMKLVYKSKSIMLENENLKRLNNKDIQNMNQALDVIEAYDKVDVNSLAQNREQRYFNNSKMDYSEKDMENFENLYYKTISKSWIESKEDAEKYKYIYWLRLEKQFKETPNVNSRAIQKIDSRINEMEMANPKLRRDDFIKNGELNPKYKQEIAEYENMKFVGDLLSDYVLDESLVESPEDFEKLSKNEKIKYLLNSYLGLAEKSDESGTINKIAKRRLEIISTPEKNFVTQDENKNIIVNEKTFCEEYSKLTNREFKDFERFDNLYHNYKKAHIRTRLDMYSKNTKEEFVKLQPGTDKERALQVEKIKSRNYLLRSLNAIGKSKSKKQRQKLNETEGKSVDNSAEQNSKKEQTNTYTNPQKYQVEGNYIETSEIKDSYIGVNSYSSKKQDLLKEEKAVQQEAIENVQENSSDIPKESRQTLLDKFKKTISNLGKSSDEKSEKDKDDIENKEFSNELLPVKQKKGLFSIIADKFKNLFTKDENKVEQDSVVVNSDTQISSFDAQLRAGTENVDIAAAIRKTQENSKNMKEGTIKKDFQEQSDSDDVVFGG